MTRFQPATEEELEAFVDDQKCLNTKRSTKTAINLLNQYRVEAYSMTDSFLGYQPI